MPTHMVTLAPGVNAEATPTLNGTSIQTCNRIRFSPSGLPEKLGGWLKFYGTAIGSTVTALHAWEDLTGALHLAYGATEELGVITSGTRQVITPQVIVTNNAPNFSTTAGSNQVVVFDAASNVSIYDAIIFETQVSVGGVVIFGAYSSSEVQSIDSYIITAASNATATVSNGGVVPVFTATAGFSTVSVSLPNHGLSVGSTFPIEVPVTVGGLTLSNFYTVSRVFDANTFQITAVAAATSTQTVAMNGGNARILYYIAPNPNLVGSGYGDGGYGEGGYGYGETFPPNMGTPITATDYTLDHFGGDLIACPANGPIFVWNSQSGLTAAQMIPSAPTANTGIFVSMSAEIIIAYGSSVLGIQDPLLVRWCSAGNDADWTGTTTNTAGQYRLPKGSRIIGGLQGPQYGLLWTDIDVWSMTFIGYPPVFGFVELSTGCGLAGKFAAGVLGSTVYWMSYAAPTVGTSAGGAFYALPAGGSVTPVPCSVWDFVFQNIDNAHLGRTRCAVNSQFGEIQWFFPVVGGNGENAAYVKFTPQFNAWDYGLLGRSAWIDQSVFGPPIGADATSNYIYQHETSNDGDGVALGESFTTGYFALTDGQDKAFCDLIYPDMRYGFLGGAQSAVVPLSFTYTDEASGAPVYTTPTYTMSSTGPAYITPRFRARLTSMTMGPSNAGSFWRLGGLRARTTADGRL